MDSGRYALYEVVITDHVDNRADVSALLDDARPRLERALVARFGIDDGLDAAAEALAYGVEHWPKLSTMTNPIGYLYRVGDTAGQRLRRRWNRVAALVEEPQSVDQPLDVDLQRALLKLKPEHRVAVVLVYAHGYSYAEAADVLDVPLTTITNYLNRGLARLRTVVEAK